MPRMLVKIEVGDMVMRVTAEMLKAAGWVEFCHGYTGMAFWRSPLNHRLYTKEHAAAIYKQQMKENKA